MVVCKILFLLLGRPEAVKCSVSVLVAFGELAGAALRKEGLHCWYDSVSKSDMAFLNCDLVPVLYGGS